MKKYRFTKLQLAWLEALESGNFIKQEGRLTRLDDQGRPVACCCLGVACEVALARGIKLKTTISAIGMAYDGEDKYLPAAMREKLKLRTRFGDFKAQDGYADLTSMNDSGISHKEIAAYIRANPWNVFAA